MKPNEDQVLTVIGAGPVGALLALMLAQQGHRVQVFERRPDMRRHSISAGRSINLAVSTRGLHALRRVGLEQFVLDQAVPMLGRMMHAKDGQLSYLPYGRDESEYINSMSRGELNKLLMNQAEKTGRVQIHFEHSLQGYDLDTEIATVRDEQGRRDFAVQAPIIFGSDGSASALRSALVDRAGVACSQSTLDAGYKELTMLPQAVGAEAQPAGKFRLKPNALHIWPRGKFMLIALGNPDGSFTCTLFLPFVAKGDSLGFDQLHDRSSASAFFEEHFGDFVPHMPDLAEQFLAAPTGSMVTVKTSRWAHEAALLIGDAAHAIVPFFGQGMNCGFEDVVVLAEMLQTHENWHELFAAFSSTRKPNSDAIADMAVENFTEMRDKVADPEFLLHKAVEAELSRRMPGKYLSRYQLVTFSRVPYAIALQAGLIQAEILREVCLNARVLTDVDLAAAQQMAEKRLLPFLAQHL